MRPADGIAETVSWKAVFLFLLLIIAIIAAGAIFYQSQEQQIKERVSGELTTIALLKTDQIAAWRNERLGDGEVLSGNPVFIERVSDYLKSPDPAGREKILTLFGQINASYHYRNLQLADPQGRVVLSLDPGRVSLTPAQERYATRALALRETTLTDLTFGADNKTPEMYVVAPLVSPDTGTITEVGTVIMTIDPTTDLYPLVQSWPVPSSTAEALLVERSGDSVLYLNTLRHQNNTALNLTIPLSLASLPAVNAVLGATGPYTGTDYRGVDVISVLEPIPGSPWFMVAKVDTAEAYTSWRERSGIIVLLVAGVLAGAVVIAGWAWQRRQKYYFRSLYNAETGRRETEQKNRERIETLLQLTKMDTASEQELADYVLDAACRLMESPFAFIGTMSPDESVFDKAAWSQPVRKEFLAVPSPAQIPVGKAGIWAEAIRMRAPVVINSCNPPVTGDEEKSRSPVPVTRFVSVPIFDSGRIVMAGTVANKDSEYSQEDVNNLTLLMQGVWAHFRKRRADEVLKQKTSDLEAAYEEITASEEELRANYDELDRNQQALKASEQRYRNLFENMQEGLAYCRMVYDQMGMPVDFVYLSVNHAFDRIIGAGAVIGKPAAEVFPGIREAFPQLFEIYGRVALTAIPESFDIEFIPIGKWLHISVYSPGREHFVAVFSDITGQKHAEQQREALIRELEQKNAELERFAYSVSHDLKSPLITIKGFAGLLENDFSNSDPVQLKRDIRRIIHAAETMQCLLSDVLELSRIGRVVSPPVKTAFGSIVQEALELLAMPLSKRNVSVEVAPDLPYVNVDHTRIREVMVNLIENAIKFSGNRPDPVIRIGIDRTGLTPVFFVQDNGIGIDPHYLGRIFNLFEKLDPDYPGTGVGLTIVKRIIDVHGGKIWAESEGVGKGTTIRFTLPLADDTPDQV